jgi:hypothetical protein
VGEISSVGASSSVCLVGVASPSILSSYEWVHKDLLAGLKIGDLGFSTLAVCELVKGRTAVFGSMGPFEVGDSPQTVPVEVSGSRGCPSETKVSPAKVVEKVGATSGGMGPFEAGDSP